MKPAEIVHAMAERSMKKLRIAFVMPGGVYTYLAAAKRVKTEDGGPEISNPIMIGGNPNVGPATYYDRVPVERTSELDTVRYNMTRIVGTYVISEQELDENKGSAVIVSIAAAKMKNLEMSFKNYQRKRAVGANSGKDPYGLGNLLPMTNTSGSLGGINLATTPQFRHEVYDFTGSALTPDTIEDAFDDILLDMNHDDSKVTVIFAGRNVVTMHRKAAKNRVSIQLNATGFGKTLANLGLTGSRHQEIPIIYDEELDPNIAYFINENEMMIHFLKGVNMKLKSLTAPYDQDVIGKRYISEYQLCSWKNKRTHAVVKVK